MGREIMLDKEEKAAMFENIRRDMDMNQKPNIFDRNIEKWVDELIEKTNRRKRDTDNSLNIDSELDKLMEQGHKPLEKINPCFDMVNSNRQGDISSMTNLWVTIIGFIITWSLMIKMFFWIRKVTGNTSTDYYNVF